MQSSPRKEKSKRRKKNWKTKSKDVHFFHSIYISKTQRPNKWTWTKKQMNHKNKDVRIYSKYRLVFIFYMFLTIFIHITYLYTSQTLKNQKKKTKKNHKMIKKTHSF